MKTISPDVTSSPGLLQEQFHRLRAEERTRAQRSVEELKAGMAELKP